MHMVDSYVGRQAAWHRLGKVTGQFMTWTDILAAGGLDYEVLKAQLEFHGAPVDAWGTFRLNGGETDITKATFLGTVGQDYEVIQHARGFELVDRLMGKVDGAHYETAGSLGEGQVVWGLADLKQSIWLGHDEIKSYLLFVTAHDGSTKHQYRLCNTRVVCQNTINIALNEKVANIFSVKHTVNAGERLDDAETALMSLTDNMQSVGDRLKFLASRKLTTAAITQVFDQLLPKTAKKDEDGDSTRRSNILMDIMMLYADNDGNMFPEQRGTGYNLLNSITNYADHSRVVKGSEKNPTARAESALFGLGDKLKSRALTILTEVARDGALTNTAVVFAPAPPVHEDSPMLNDVVGNEVTLLDNIADHTTAQGVEIPDTLTTAGKYALTPIAPVVPVVPAKKRGRPARATVAA